MNALDLNLSAWSSGWGDPSALGRMTDEIAAFNARLATVGGQCTRGELRDIQTILNTLALAIARIERIVTDRIADLGGGVRNGD